MLQETRARFENVTDYDAELFYGWWVTSGRERSTIITQCREQTGRKLLFMQECDSWSNFLARE